MTVAESVQIPQHSEEEPAVNPFSALRVSYGMLLGVDDFETLVGYPHGKQMLHNAWLHGTGVVWGLGVKQKGRQLVVGTGLALDGVGRELLLTADECLDVEAWLKKWRATADQQARTEDVCAWVVARYQVCLDGPVPALADPCDLARKHNDYSRFVETVHVELSADRPTPAPLGFRRIRALLGLGPVDDDCRRAIDRATHAPPDERAERLLEAFRQLAALDVRDVAPWTTAGDNIPQLFPVAEEDAGVVLAKVYMRQEKAKDSGETIKLEILDEDRQSLLPTRTIQELVCGLAPGVLGDRSQPDAGGPRVDPRSITWVDDQSLTFTVDRELLEPSLRGEAIEMTSLSDRGWVGESIEKVRYSDAAHTVSVDLHDPPAYEHVRLIVRGTGRTPVVGADHIPLAGVLGGPPGTEHDGHDAVLTFQRRTVS